MTEIRTLPTLITLVDSSESHSPCLNIPRSDCVNRLQLRPPNSSRTPPSVSDLKIYAASASVLSLPATASANASCAPSPPPPTSLHREGSSSGHSHQISHGRGYKLFDNVGNTPASKFASPPPTNPDNPDLGLHYSPCRAAPHLRGEQPSSPNLHFPKYAKIPHGEAAVRSHGVR
jgi:hypothetical protein